MNRTQYILDLQHIEKSSDLKQLREFFPNGCFLI